MRKSLCIFISFILILSINGCGVIYIDDSKEQAAYKKTIASLFDALDNKNQDEIYDLFSPHSKEQDENLKEKISELLSVYEGPVSEIGWDGLLAGGTSYEAGKTIKDAYTTFPVRCNETYFWFKLKIVYENTFDKDEIGITQLNFYTADEYCMLWYDDMEVIDTAGLQVYAERTIREDIRCINGLPYKYSSSTDSLDINEVKNFLKSQNSFAAFKSNFGEPNANLFYEYYSLSTKNEEQQYLEIGRSEDKIHHVSIVDDFSYIETLYKNYEQ